MKKVGVNFWWICSGIKTVILLYQKKQSLKGTHFIVNEQNERIDAQIDLKIIKNYHQAIEDSLDGIVAEEKTLLPKVISSLKKTERLKP